MCISLHMVRPGLTTLFSFLLLILNISVPEAYSNEVRFVLVNQCKYRVWPASLTINGNTNLPTFKFGLHAGEKLSINASTTWNGHFWGRTNCTTDSATGNFSCVTGDCGTGKIECNINQGVSPATRAEFRLGNDGVDFYNVNVIEGFNIPIAVTPMGAFGQNLNCSSAGCPANLNTMCPTELKVMKNEKVVACQGACSTDNLQKICCLKNNFSTVENCDPSAYSLTLKTACPRAYSFPYDNVTNTFSCSSKLYKIIFCPASSADSTESLDESVSIGDSLIAGNGTTRWLSSSGEFAFGFYQLPNELFLVAIWYDKIQNDSIIWYVNDGDNPAPKGSRLVLNDSHGLVLTNPKGLELWRSSYFNHGRILKGLMKDDGNFQLRDQNFIVLWESFDHSSDTLVPGQEFYPNDYLYSRQGEFNFSRGRFELRIQKTNGDVVLLNLINLHNHTTQRKAYYDSGNVDPDNESSNVGHKFIFDKSGLFLYILKNDGTKFKIITNPNETIPKDGFYFKATINYDGVFTLSYYPKNGQSWVVANTIPENICLDSTFNNGQGICGLNSICTLRDDRRPMCTCLDGYSLIDSNNMYGGCIENDKVICKGRHQGSQNDTHVMMNLPNTYWPNSGYETLSPRSLEECKESCLQDCLCVLVSFDENSCWKKKLPLSQGRQDPTLKGISIMKMKKNDTIRSLPNATKDHDDKMKEKKVHNTLIIVISTILGILVVIFLSFISAIFFWVNHKKIKSSATNKSVHGNLRIFTFKEITEATNNFTEELGRGSCSIVYKGTINVDANVAIKKLDKLFQDSDKEFQTEMNVIIQTHHRNLVRLHGYCSEEQHRILVYELMSNGTLASFLFTPLKPNWNQRVHIAIGIARGLVYLHEECCTQIIHCDIKPQNILLDDDYNAKISDFGLAKLLLISQSHTKTGIRGTKGYVAPDWFRSAPISTKVDAYSFGVLLLEIICCRKNVENDNVSEEKRILTDWAYDCYKVKKLDILLENECEAVNDMTRVEKYVMIAIWCTQEDPSLRPTMKKVLLMLEEIVEVAIPPSPYLYGSFGSN